MAERGFSVVSESSPKYWPGPSYATSLKYLKLRVLAALSSGDLSGMGF